MATPRRFCEHVASPMNRSRHTPGVLSLALLLPCLACTRWPAPFLVPGDSLDTSPVEEGSAEERGPRSTERTEEMPHVKPIGDEPWVEDTTQPGEVLLPRDAPGSTVLSCAVLDSDGREVGRVADVLLDRDGRMLGCVVAASGATQTPFVDRAWCRFEVSSRGLALRLGLESRATFAASASTGGGEASVIEGIVTEVDPAESIAGANIFKLHDEDNLVHRFHVEPSSLIEARFDGPLVGRRLAVEGILTRDRKGKLWIARELVSSAESVRLRDPEMNIVWDELTSHFDSVRRMIGAPVQLADGQRLTVEEVDLDLATAEVTGVRVSTEFGPCELERWRLVRTETGYRTDVTLPTLEALARKRRSP